MSAINIAMIAFIVMMGIAMIVCGCYLMKPQNWVKTIGNIRSAEIIEDADGDYLKIEYSFKAPDVPHTYSKGYVPIRDFISATQIPPDDATLQAALRSLHNSTPVDIWFAQQNPNDSSLNCPSNSTRFFTGILSIFIGVTFAAYPFLPNFS